MEKFEPIVKRYYDALEEGKILARKCNRCGAVSYPPMPICQECSSTDTVWTELNPDGMLIGFDGIAESHIWQNIRCHAPIYWAEVVLADGMSLTSIVLGITDPVDVAARLPLPVKAEIIQDDGFKSVLFRLAE